MRTTRTRREVLKTIGAIAAATPVLASARPRPTVAIIGGIECHHASLALRTDPIYASVNPDYRSFLNGQLLNGGSTPRGDALPSSV